LTNALQKAWRRGRNFLDLTVLPRIKDGIDERTARPSMEALVDSDLERHFKDKKPTIMYVSIRYDYGRNYWGLSYEHFQFYETLLNMDYSLIYFDYDVIRKKHGERKASQMLREAVYLYHPDILFYNHFGDWIQHEVWAEISDNLPTKTIIMLADDHWRYKESEPVWRLFNLVLTTDQAGFRKRMEEGFTNVFLTQWGCNHFLYSNLNLQRTYDVTFVGRCYGERKSFVQGLREKGVKITAFGQGWENGGRISQANLIRIYNESKISLNISIASTGSKTQIKGRDFEAVACGSLLLTKNTEDIGRYFVPGKEIVTYENLADASEKIEYYLRNEEERQEIAKNGYERFIRDHTMERRLSEVLSFAQKM